MADGGFCMELIEGPKNRGLVEQPDSVPQGCAEDARVRGGCGRGVVMACHERRTSKRSGWAGTGRQMRGRRWSGILRQNLKKCPCQNKYIDAQVSWGDLPNHQTHDSFLPRPSTPNPNPSLGAVVVDINVTVTVGLRQLRVPGAHDAAHSRPSPFALVLSASKGKVP